MDNIVAYLIVACNDKTSVSASEIVTHRKGPQETVAFILNVRGLTL